MKIWCPTCGNESFLYEVISSRYETLEDGQNHKICKDRLACRQCAYSFTIEWFDAIRTSFVRDQMASKAIHKMSLNQSSVTKTLKTGGSYDVKSPVHRKQF